jgi:hypothetical protein
MLSRIVAEFFYDLAAIVDSNSQGSTTGIRVVDRAEAAIIQQETIACDIVRISVPSNNQLTVVNTAGECAAGTWDVDSGETAAAVQKSMLHLVVVSLCLHEAAHDLTTAIDARMPNSASMEDPPRGLVL